MDSQYLTLLYSLTIWTPEMKIHFLFFMGEGSMARGGGEWHISVGKCLCFRQMTFHLSPA